MNRAELVKRIADAMLAREASSFAIVAAPGAGKTQFLGRLAGELRARSGKVAVYGPVSAETFLDAPTFRGQVVDWLAQEELLAAEPDREACALAVAEASFWGYIAGCLDLRRARGLVILLDDVSPNGSGPEHLYRLFGTLRKFCNEWHHDALAVHFVSCGNWLRSEVYDVFQACMTSWPFVLDESLFALPDLTLDETRAWLELRLEAAPVRDLHARFLFDLTAGDAATLNQLLTTAGAGPYSCDRAYEDAVALLESEAYCDRLRGQVVKLDADARQLLLTLLNGQFPLSRKAGDAGEQLLLAGLVREECVGELRLLRLKNWVIESGLRHHWPALRDLIDGDVCQDYAEFVPPITCLNRDAYGFICEIENLLRNFALERLHHYAEGRHPLAIVPYSANKSDDYATEYDAADDWRRRQIKEGKVSAHPATVSFSKTDQLKTWINHLRYQRQDPPAARFAYLLKELDAFKGIRDAVNHNQIITEASYDKLVSLRKTLYRALVTQ